MNIHDQIGGYLPLFPPAPGNAADHTRPFWRELLDYLPLGLGWQREGLGMSFETNTPFRILLGTTDPLPTDITELAALLPPENRAAYLASLTQLRKQQAEIIQLEFCLSTPMDNPWRELTLRRVRSKDGHDDLLVLLADIQERKQHAQDMQRAIASADSLNVQIESALDLAQRSAVEANLATAAIRQLAVLDELTGLYNRRGFNTLHHDILQKTKSPGTHGYLCCFDLDRFKQINDVHGHAKGDEALVEFAQLLRATFPENTLLVRLGGDEFIALGLETQPRQVRESLELLENCLTRRNATGTGRFQLETSWGLFSFDSSSTATTDELMAAADADLYRNKEARRRVRLLPDPQT